MRIAHLSDLHLLETSHEWRGVAEQCRLRYLSAGRELDPEGRRARAIAALRTAGQADYVVITGDLTEEGTPAQFEVLAEVLSDAGVRRDRITIVPGNHDAYAGHDAFERALEGPLRPFAATSKPGVPVDLGCTTLLPISTLLPQSFMRSAGTLQPRDAEQIDARARQGRLLLVAQHHPPLRTGTSLWNWINGTENAGAAGALVAHHDNLHVLHGHLHVLRSRAVADGRPGQVHCANAVVEDETAVRFYDLDGVVLTPCEADPSPGGVGDDRARPRLRDGALGRAGRCRDEFPAPATPYFQPVRVPREL